jgi:hypothetical protein
MVKLGMKLQAHSTADVNIELVQSGGVGGLTRESTKTESFATNVYKNPDDDPSLDTVKANVHTGWYVGGTPESKR